MSKNGEKNGVQPPEGKRFSSENQPSPEAKKKGWDRKRRQDQFMDRVTKFQNMDYNDLNKIANKLRQKNKKDPKSSSYGSIPRIKVGDKYLDTFDLLAFQYVWQALGNSKILLDFIDRIVPKAPQNIELDTPEPITAVEVTIIRNKADVETLNSGNSGS